MWYYNNKLYDTTPEDFQGFVYEITELDTDKKYIGKKNFWKPKTLPSLKNVRDEYERVQSLTGNNIMDRPMKYANLWKNMESKSSEEKY